MILCGGHQVGVRESPLKGSASETGQKCPLLSTLPANPSSVLCSSCNRNFASAQGQLNYYMEMPFLQRPGNTLKYKNNRNAWKQLQTADPLDIADLLEDSSGTSNSHCA